MILSNDACIQINQAIFSIANAYRSKMQRDGVVEETGLGLPDRSTLMVLGQLAPTTARILSKAMDINAGTISVYVQRLVDKALVARTQDQADRRTWWLSLTNEGQVAYKDTLLGAAAYTRKFLSPLSADEQASLHAMLLRVSSELGYQWQSNPPA
ncbi:MarR family transcriptional regulator [Candidatus Bipolaricaulota bacterium]|nr:MarR family transcriptional regulator [Candidatus Bipolaricaulota bacterium]